MGLRLRHEEKGQGKISDLFKEVKPSYVVAKEGKRQNEKSVDENLQGKELENGLTKDESDFIKAKKALHLAAPISLPCRQPQIEELYTFVKDHLLKGTGGSLYISGAPGTGKTAVVQHVLDTFKYPNPTDGDYEKLAKLRFIPIFINCMNSSSIVDDIYKELNITSKIGDMYEKIAKRVVSKHKNARPIVIVLDEMDQLLNRSRNIMYKIFEWARLPGTRLVLIGIANSLDLTVRQLPLLSSSPKTSSPKPRVSVKGRTSISMQQPVASHFCKLMQFPPYDRSDIEQILERRMTEVGSSIFEPTAIKFLAAKVAASTGDMRKALNACQAALDAGEKVQRPILKATSDDGFNGSPKKQCFREEKIGVSAMSKALAPQRDEGVLPLQQRIILATLLKINKDAPNSVNCSHDGVTSAIPVVLFYDIYRKICTDKGFTWIDRSELPSICGLLEDRSFLHVSESASSNKKMKSKSSNKAGMFFQPSTVEKFLRNDPVVASIVG